MSFGGSSEKLEKLLNAKNFQNKIINTQRVRLKKWWQSLLKKWHTNRSQKLNHERYSKVKPQLLFKKKRYSKIGPQTFLKKWSINDTQNWVAKVTQNLSQKHSQKLTHKRYSKIDPQTLFKKCETLTCSWFFKN